MPLNTNISPPIASKMPKSITLHGETRTDNYAWLRDDNWQQVLQDPNKLSSHIRAHLDAENAYTNALTAPLKGLQETIFEELKGRIPEDDTSAAVRWDEYWYYHRTEAGKQYPLHCRRKGSMDAPEEVYFDVNEAAAGRDYYKAAAVKVSPNHKRLVVLEDLTGSLFFTLRVIDIATGKELSRPIHGAEGSVVWAADSDTLFYTVLDENQRPSAVYRHKVGSPPQDNQPVYNERDHGFFLSVYKSSDDSQIIIEASSQDASECHYLSAHMARKPFKCFKKRENGVLYSLDYADEEFYILTNKDGAIDFKICACPYLKSASENWRDVVPHQRGRFIVGLGLIKGHLIYETVAEANSDVWIHHLESGSERQLPAEGDAYTNSWNPHPMFDDEVVSYTHETPAHPPQIVDFHLKTGETTIVKEVQVPSGHSPDDYKVSRTYALSHDGEEVPVTVFHHKNTPLDGSAPLWLYGYGAYGLHCLPEFSALTLSLVDRGFVYAIAHIRGGAEKGYGWYLDGKLRNKKNTFHDYIACAEHLIAEGFTSTGNIFAEGGSAGGLLMAVVANMRPDLWKLMHLGSPYVDVLNSMSDMELPLTPPEFPEWGNPIESEKDFSYMASYCPYHNMSQQAYPHMLVTSSLTDAQVTYWEPAKYIAKMREVNTADTLTILQMEMATGHCGASGRYDALKEYAFEYAVVLTLFDRA